MQFEVQQGSSILHWIGLSFQFLEFGACILLMLLVVFVRAMRSTRFRCNSCLLFKGANFSVVAPEKPVWHSPSGIFCCVHSIEHGSNHEADEAESFCQRFNASQNLDI